MTAEVPEDAETVDETYVRVNPEDFEDGDEIDSTTVTDEGAPTNG